MTKIHVKKDEKSFNIHFEALKHIIIGEINKKWLKNQDLHGFFQFF